MEAVAATTTHCERGLPTDSPGDLLAFAVCIIMLLHVEGIDFCRCLILVSLAAVSTGTVHKANAQQQDRISMQGSACLPFPHTQQSCTDCCVLMALKSYAARHTCRRIAFRSALLLTGRWSIDHWYRSRGMHDGMQPVPQSPICWNAPPLMKHGVPARPGTAMSKIRSTNLSTLR